MTEQPIFFITGTGTDVGKTFVAKLLVYGWHCNYWKPVQTGIESDCGDTFTVTHCPIGKWNTLVFPPRYELQKPLSPLAAMEYETNNNNKDIKLEDFQIPDGSDKAPLIIESAGGVYVPITKKLEVTTDLITHLIESTTRPFYVIVVTNSGLGTLNHSLLTWEYLKQKVSKKNLLGCILNGKANKNNRQLLEQYGINIITEIPICDDLEMCIQVIEKLPSLEYAINKY